MLRAFLFIGLFCAASARAMPPFNYDAALRWADETVTSDIPKADRIYILGPDKVMETYTHNGLLDRHEVEVRRAVRWQPQLALRGALAQVPFDTKKSILLEVYRAGARPQAVVLTAPEGFKGLIVIESGSFVIDGFQMQKRDVILLKYEAPDDKKPRPNL